MSDKKVVYDMLSKLNQDYLEIQKLIDETSKAELSSIIKTIDDVQNTIIRNDDHKTNFINGGPGTGKSTVGLHVLSYSVYNPHNYSKLKPNILIIILNNHFEEYIKKYI